MTTALAIVTTVIDKKLVEQVQRQQRGPKGYGLLAVTRTLLYAVMEEVFSTRKLHRRLGKKPWVAQKLGLPRCPDKRTLDRWKRRYWHELEQLVTLLGDRYLILQRGREWTILDSTPLEDPNDPDARVGYTSRGEFKGFKVHQSCDEHSVPLRALVTTGNIHDSVPAAQLLAPTPRVGGDAGYDAAWL